VRVARFADFGENQKFYDVRHESNIANSKKFSPIAKTKNLDFRI